MQKFQTIMIVISLIAVFLLEKNDCIRKKATHTPDMGCGSLVINLNMSVSNFIY